MEKRYDVEGRLSVHMPYAEWANLRDRHSYAGRENGRPWALVLGRKGTPPRWNL